MATIIRRNRAQLDVQLAGSRRRRYMSPGLFSTYRALEPILAQQARGRVLDVGCGAQPYRHLFGPEVTSYDGFDVERRVPDVRFVGDAQDMATVPTRAYDTVLCTEVLEHVPEPHRVLAEIRRVLVPGGTLILTTPFLARLHEEPHDYYRYTVWGLQHLLRSEAFDVVEIEATASVCSFLGHQASTALVGVTWGLPLLGSLVFWLNAAVVTIPCHALDRWLRLGRLFPLSYVAVARTATVSP